MSFTPRRALSALALAVVLIEAAPVAAAPSVVPGAGEPAPVAAREVLAAELRMRLAIFRSGAAAPAALVEPDGPRVLVRLRGPLSEADAAALARVGFTVDRLPDGRLVAGEFQSGHVGWSALEALAGHPLVARIEPARAVVSLRPLETIGVEQGTLRAHLRPVDGVTGAGVVVAAIDSPIDVLHPHFFHADGGVYSWVDLDGDGRFSAGDGVALEDRVASLVVMDGGFFDPVSDPANWQNFDDVLDPGLDWLFADLDGDGQRGAGARAGFGDDDPALGEPLFVAHDADGDGALGVEEKLFRLGTSKIRQVMVGGQTWRRDDGLAVAADVGRQSDSSHGTGVASILIGGQPGFHRRIGLAPGAEYLSYAGVDTDRSAVVFTDAAENGARLLLHEWSQPTGVPGDGGSLFELMMDRARRDGLLQVCPLGNLNGAGKQIERVADGTVSLPFVVGDGFFDGQQTLPYSQVILHLAWTSDAMPSALRWRLPSGESMALEVDSQPRGLGDETQYAAGIDRTSRGTRWLIVYLWRESRPEAGIAAGEWAVEVDGLPAGTVVHGRVGDAYSGWSPGVAWADPTVDRSTLTYPSTADSAIGVAAYGGRADIDVLGGGGVGELRGYSGRGPRMDGARAVDVAAPDDPLAALSSSALPEFPRGHSSLFVPFGGTSGAGPHVAAALALLAERYPGWGADELEAGLLGAAEGDGLSPDLGAVPNEGWGVGKLRSHRALYGMDAVEANGAPWVERVVVDGMGLMVEGADAEGDGVWFRVDWDYDGVWEGEWQGEGWFAFDGRYGAGEAVVVRVGVRDGFGGAGERIVALVVPGVDVGVDAGGDAGGDADVMADADPVVVIIGEPDGGVGEDGSGSGGVGGCDASGGGVGGWWVLLGLLLARRRWR